MFWPLFHSMPDRATFSGEKWRAYERINNLFADQTVEALRRLQTDDSVSSDESNTPLIWVHDYHLTLAANGIRQSAKDLNIECKIGFFLHIPFPPWDIFRLCPWGDVILQGMLGCDMVGFHIEDYCINFVECCQRRLGCRVDRKNFLIEHGGRTVRARALPIGIPFDRFVHLAKTTPKVMFTNQKIILGVDRLDYTKGLVHRLGAFELLLERYSEHLGKVTLLQIAVPSRTDVKEYQELKEEMDQLVGHINGRFSTANWSPIRYIYACVGQDELAAFYRDAAVALVTPLRDGMNLVAKEFVACQINEPPGVLVVSPFAGAYETMLEALVCNPYELEEASEVIQRALTMPEDERTLRMNGLRRREKLNDVNQWVCRFLKSMGCVVEGMSDDSLPITMHPVTLDDFDYLDKCLFCLLQCLTMSSPINYCRAGERKCHDIWLGSKDTRPLHGVMGKLSKNRSEKTSIEYMGHVVSTEGNYPKQNLMAPLHPLLENEARWRWTPGYRAAFAALKTSFQDIKLLHQPQGEETLILQNNACLNGLGTALYQEYLDSKPLVIAYASTWLNATEQKYHNKEQECLAVNWTIRKYRFHLEGTHFILRTDSKALKWLRDLRNRKAKLGRSDLFLSRTARLGRRGQARICGPHLASSTSGNQPKRATQTSPAQDKPKPDRAASTERPLREGTLMHLQPFTLRDNVVWSCNNQPGAKWRIWISKDLCTNIFWRFQDHPDVGHPGTRETPDMSGTA
ncbi:hypothetical protein PR048_010575 [Dryococelus australis]|uniref:Reverse transcriptase RNase H-like domain-containing protein n=1 Tax=Dryococelus australis TaxID=614101 RepID=A0ABQ9I3X9_9NEOP|nr:hypothetical protein PR048_010575 [Dryococelus australis]